MGTLIYGDLTYRIIEAAREVYRELGTGFLESVYEEALCYELKKKKILYQQQVELDIQYKETVFKNRLRADWIVDKKVLIENKAIRALTNQDEAQLLNYLKVTELKTGLLFNFGTSKFEMKRRVM